MYSKSIRSKKLEKGFSKPFTISDECKASKASTEIMLHRFWKGKQIEFPFSR